MTFLKLLEPHELSKLFPQGVEETKTLHALEYLQSIYRNATETTGVRLRAAVEALPYENPRLSAVAVGRLTGDDFASRLDRAVDASNRAKLIEGQVVSED